MNILRSESTGSIHVTSSSPNKPPAIRFNFLSAQLDREVTLEAMRITRRIMMASPMRNIAKDEIAPGINIQSDDELLDWLRNNAETTYHPIGTCKMGSDPMAVVDDQLRVRGIARAARRRRLDHADADLGQYQCAVDHDRRESIPDDPGRGLSDRPEPLPSYLGSTRPNHANSDGTAENSDDRCAGTRLPTQPSGPSRWGTDNALRLGLSANIVRAGASEGVMRIAPPLTATEAEIDLGLELLDKALEQTLGNARHVPEARMFLAKNCCPKIKGGQS